ncbi:hypothetical protein [Naumannella cuiyingiana]|uniref:Type II toxin-antitoxin system RelE/ParE family toxin n=1 Tax=Naumannella cuiyingiana TaxID=1347891 RepID=A0A7Z0D9W1_9ACTN|nr:hypothetical protein [Naumannella cuiyingiana]NYI71472.1 hypothetical protein [Naumannella cuiyingiana]
MGRKGAVPRPVRTTEYAIVFGTRQAERGWQALLANQRNRLAEAWDDLVRDPNAITPTMHPLRGALADIERDGRAHQRRQYELSGGARIWYFVTERTVVLENVHTRHPNQTK